MKDLYSKYFIKLSFWLLVIICISCSQDEVKVPDGKFLISGEVGYVKNIYGIYEVGEPLDESHYVLIDLHVNKPTKYDFATEQLNGIQFVGNGSLTAGDTTIKLQGVGEPIVSEQSTFSVSTKSSTEDREFSVYSFEDLDNQILFASIQYEWLGEYYTIAQTGRGDILWKLDGRSSFAAIDDDIIYLNNTNGLVAVRISDGSEVWKKPELHNAASLSLTGDDLYVASKDGVYYKLRAEDGSVEWSFTPETINVIKSAPLVAGGFVYAEVNGSIHAISTADGHSVWDVRCGILNGTPEIINEHLILATDTLLQAVNASTGDHEWKVKNDVWEKFNGIPIVFNNQVWIVERNYSSICLYYLSNGELGICYGGGGDDDFSSALENYNGFVIASNTRFPSLWFYGTSIYTYFSYGSLRDELIIHNNIIYHGDGYTLTYYKQGVGMLLSFRYHTKHKENISYSEMLAIKDNTTGVVSYPNSSAMD